MQLIFTFSFLEILGSFSLMEIYIRMSEILNFLSFRINFTNASISDVYTCVKVYTSCQFSAFFTKCTMLYHNRSTNDRTIVKNSFQSINVVTGYIGFYCITFSRSAKNKNCILFRGSKTFL